MGTLPRRTEKSSLATQVDPWLPQGIEPSGRDHFTVRGAEDELHWVHRSGGHQVEALDEGPKIPCAQLVLTGGIEDQKARMDAVHGQGRLQVRRVEGEDEPRPRATAV